MSIRQIYGDLWFFLWGQGAAVAAALVAEQQLLGAAPPNCRPPLRFAILCSGYVSRAVEHQQLHAQAGTILLTSLHVYGVVQDQDRQIGVCESRELRDLFDAGSRHTIEHPAGHIIPAHRALCMQIVKFLMTFLEVP